MIRNVKMLALTTIASLGLFAGAANAQYDESRIRQADQQTQVIGYNGQHMYFTITGYATDTIVTPFYSGPLGSAPCVIDRVLHSGGQTSYRFRVTANRGWDQMIIYLLRGGATIDADRVRVF